MNAVRSRARWGPRLWVAAAVVGSGLGGCSLANDDPYAGLPPPPSAEAILEDINLAAYGLRSYPCDLFDASVARCYRPDRWLSIREGRETLAYVHRELLGAGARFWGGLDALVETERPTVAGLNLGCYFDYAALDRGLRVVIVGPTGEGASCVNGLPGDGVSEVWIIGADFDPADVYTGVSMPASFESLLTAIPAVPVPARDVFGGQTPTVDGYFGPELPPVTEGFGVRLLPETVSVHDGIVRGLVQYRGAAPLAAPSPTEGGASVPAPSAKTGAVGIVVGLGTSRYAVPIVVRPGESAPFELPLPEGFTVEDLRVVTGWIHIEDDWRGAQLLSGPTIDPACADGLAIDGEPVAGLVPGPGQSCYVAFAQGTMPPGTRVFADAMVAVFDADGTVLDVIQPYLIRGDGSLVAPGRIMTDDNDLRLTWVDSTSRDGAIGIWVRYVRATDMSLGGRADPAAAAAAAIKAASDAAEAAEAAAEAAEAAGADAS